MRALVDLVACIICSVNHIGLESGLSQTLCDKLGQPFHVLDD